MSNSRDLQDHSFGILPYRQRFGRIEWLTIRHQAGHWGFPKGHAEPNEVPQIAALRELVEETGVIARIISNSTISESYMFTRRQQKVHKQVDYWIGAVSTKALVRPQAEEVGAFAWLPFTETLALLSFEQGRALLHKAHCALHSGSFPRS